MATALITGAAGGIGAAIAIRLAKDGFDVAINDISEDIIKTHGKEVIAKCLDFGVHVGTFAANVASHSESQMLIKNVVSDMGGIDVLVNNAGITRDGLLMRMSEEEYDSVISVNQKSVFNMTKFVAPIMRKQRRGRIINISSVVGIYGNIGQINYSASKAAVIAMTKTSSKELGDKGITVNALAPGFISTPMTDKLTDDQKSAMFSKITLGRFGTADDISAAVSFLAGKDAGYITGQVIEISGGMSF